MKARGYCWRGLAWGWAVMVWFGVGLVVGCIPGALQAGQVPVPGWRVLDRVVLPENYVMAGYRVGGLSGLDYDDKTGLLWAVSDGRQWARSVVFRWRISVEQDGGAAPRLRLEPHSVLTLSGKTLTEPLDAEGLALWNRHRFLVSHEGSRQGRWAAGVACFNQKTGKVSWSLELPPYFYPTEEEPQRGLQRNRGLESLAFSRPRPTFLYTAIESPLRQDLAQPRLSSSGPVRILRYRLARRAQPPAQRAYQADRDALFGSVVELLALPHSSRLLVMERQLLWPVGPRQRRVRLYEVDFEEPAATILDGRAAVGAEPIRPLTKRLVFDSARDGWAAPDNAEGLTWGPPVQGQPTLLVVSDDNFSPTQKTEFVLLGPR